MLKISQSALTKLVDDVRERYPQEAVGLLCGRDEACASYTIPLTNRGGRRSFLADPLEQFRAEKEIQRRAHRLIATYHSHPDGGARLSAEDRRWLRRRSEYQVVVAFGQGSAECTLAAYAPTQDDFVEIPWSIVDDT